MKNKKNTALIIEDDHISANFYKSVLEKENFTVQVSYTASLGLDILKNSDIDVLILDLNLPDMDGINILKHMYKNPRYNQVSVVIATCKDDEIDIVIGLELGADDYIIKPVRPREMMARIKNSMVKKQYMFPANSESIKFGDNEFDFSSKQLKNNGKNIKLGSKEYHMLLFFLSNPDRIFTRGEILKKIWFIDSDIDTRTVDVHVSGIRKKIKDTSHKYIETVRGIGYRFNKI